MNTLIATVEAPGTGAVAREAAVFAASLRALGHRVAILVPRAGGESGGEVPEDAEGAARFNAAGEEFVISKTRRRGAADVIHLWHRDFGGPESFYGVDGPDAGGAARRCALFCRGAVEAARRMNPPPQAVLPLDWPAALIAALIKQDRLPLATALPVLDSRLLGLADGHVFGGLGLDGRWFTPETGEFFGRFSFLKTGLAACDRILVRGGRVLYDLQHNPGEPLAGMFRALAGKARLFAPAAQVSAASLTARAKAARLDLPAVWRRGGMREKLPVLVFSALDGSCLHEALRAARLLAQTGWNVLMDAPEPLRGDAALVELDDPAQGVAVVPRDFSRDDLFAVADAVFFCSEHSRDAAGVQAAAANGAWPVPVRRPHLAEALDLALATESLAPEDPPRFTFDHATEEALLDAGRALWPYFEAGPGRRARNIAEAAARSAELALARFGDPLALLNPGLKARKAG